VLLACCVEHGTHIKVRDLQMMSWPRMVEIRLVRCVVEERPTSVGLLASN